MRRVSLETGGIETEQTQEVVNGEGGSLQVSTTVATVV